VVGASGFLGSRLLALAPRDLECTGTFHERPLREGPWREARLDVTSPAAVESLVARERPGAVLYLAYHKADAAVTVDGARTAARAAAAAGARFLLTSTDLVFDGERAPYAEHVPAQPVMPYGSLKLEAEAAVRDAHPDAVVLRPALMVGASGPVRRPAYEVDRLEAGEPVDAYADEWRTPVHVDDVARAAWELVLGDAAGTFHLGGPERMTRHTLARLACRLFGFDEALVREARRPADRPRDVSLDSSRLTELLGWTPQKLSDLVQPAMSRG
jgi:dTDP-4-dehydrorhamnose reductase